MGSIARSTALTSSSVMGEDSLLSERDDFDIGSKEDCFSSLTTNVLVSYIPRNRATLKQRTWCNLWLYDSNSNFTCVVCRMKKLHTGSIFIFLAVAPLEVLWWRWESAAGWRAWTYTMLLGCLLFSDRHRGWLVLPMIWHALMSSCFLFGDWCGGWLLVSLMIRWRCVHL